MVRVYIGTSLQWYELTSCGTSLTSGGTSLQWYELTSCGTSLHWYELTSCGTS